MNFTKYFKHKDYDNLDRFLLHHKFRSSRDPFEGDPFKIQSLNFRYADKPIFYPISNRSKLFANAENPQKKNGASDNSKQFPLTKNARKSSLYSFPAVSKPKNQASISVPQPSTEFLERAGYLAAKKFDFNRSRSFIHQPISVPFSEEAAPLNHHTVLKTNILKSKNSIGTRKRTNSITAINVDHSSGCKISIKIDGVPTNQVHINEKVENSDSYQNMENSISNPTVAKIVSAYELKPSRSYVIHRDDTAVDICSNPRKSSRKLLQECSTHSMIPHKEAHGTLNEFRKSSSAADTIGVSSSLRLKTGSRGKTNRQLNLSRKYSGNVCLENLAPKNPLAQRIPSRINLQKQASMLEKILSNNTIVAQSRKSFHLAKSKSVLDQRFTPSPMSNKYTFENNNLRTR